MRNPESIDLYYSESLIKLGIYPSVILETSDFEKAAKDSNKRVIKRESHSQLKYGHKLGISPRNKVRKEGHY